MERQEGWGVLFRRRHSDPDLEYIYSLRDFRFLSMHINTMFIRVISFVDMSYMRGGGRSRLCLQGNNSLAVPLQDSWYGFSWCSWPPRLRPEDQPSGFLGNIIFNQSTRRLVPVLYKKALTSSENHEGKVSGAHKLVQ